MVSIIDEILNEMQNVCDNNTFEHLKNFIIVKLNGYKIERQETGIVKYEMSESEKWFKMFFIAKNLQGLSNRSLKYYKSELERTLKAINKPIGEITTNDIRYYLACIQLKGKSKQISIDNTRRVLNTFFQWLQDEEYITKNPVKRIKKSRQKKEIKKSFSFEEIEKLKMACKSKREIALINFLLSTGTRAEETTNVKISDINFVTGEVMVNGKGNKERIVFLNATALLRLKDYINSRKSDSEYVFSGEISPYSKIGVSVIESVVKKVGKRADVKKVHPHRFRRTCATIASKRGMPIEEISKMLGHENLGTTQIYVQVDAEDIRKSHEKYMN